jgi:hypothetical protein
MLGTSGMLLTLSVSRLPFFTSTPSAVSSSQHRFKNASYFHSCKLSSSACTLLLSLSTSISFCSTSCAFDPVDVARFSQMCHGACSGASWIQRSRAKTKAFLDGAFFGCRLVMVCCRVGPRLGCVSRERISNLSGMI